MEIKIFDYNNLSLEFNQLSTEMNDKVIGKLAMVLRKEYPTRREIGNKYFAINTELKRIIIIDENSVSIRFDEINEIEEVITNAGEVANTIATVLELGTINLSANLKVEVKLADKEEGTELSKELLRPIGIWNEDIPGEITGYASRVTFESGDYDYDFYIDPYFDGSNLIYIDFDMDANSDDVRMVIDKDEIIHKLIDFKYLLEGTTLKIVEKW